MSHDVHSLIMWQYHALAHASVCPYLVTCDTCISMSHDSQALLLLAWAWSIMHTSVHHSKASWLAPVHWPAMRAVLWLVIYYLLTIPTHDQAWPLLVSSPLDTTQITTQAPIGWVYLILGHPLLAFHHIGLRPTTTISANPWINWPLVTQALLDYSVILLLVF